VYMCLYVLVCTGGEGRDRGRGCIVLTGMINPTDLLRGLVVGLYGVEEK